MSNLKDFIILKDLIKISQELNECSVCKSQINLEQDFKDEISKKEYYISGLCQDCQDIAFKDDEFDLLEDEIFEVQNCVTINNSTIKLING